MKGFINMMFFFIAFSSACFLLQSFSVLPINYAMSTSVMTDIGSYFDLTKNFGAILGLTGAAAIGITGILTRSGTYALYAVLIFAICAFFPILQYFVLAIPNTIYGLVTMVGLGSDVTSPLVVTIGLWALVWGAMYMFGLLFSRDMT